MSQKNFSFSASEDMLVQLRYALVDRIHDLEELLSKGDSDEGWLQSDLDLTRKVAIALGIAEPFPNSARPTRDGG